MTVTTTNASGGPYAPDGIVTTFPFTFDASGASDVQVVRRSAGGVDTVLGGYTVTLGSPGGSAVFSVAPAAGDPIYVLLNPDFTQETTFANQGAFSATSLDDALDQAARRDIFLNDAVGRSIRAPKGEAAIGELPSAAARAGLFCGFDASGSPVALNPGGADAGLRTDLAATTGSLLVRWIGTWVGAVARTVRDKLQERVTPFDFGAVGDGVTNDLASLQAFSDWFFNDGTVKRKAKADFSGTFGIDGTLYLGSTSAPTTLAGQRFNVGGDLCIQQLGAHFETVKVRNFQDTHFRGTITAMGTGGAVYSTRTAGVGIHIGEQSAMARFGGLFAEYFWLAGVVARGDTADTPDSTVIGANLGMVCPQHCGSGYSQATGGDPTFNLMGNWSSPVNSGTTTDQLTTINVTTLPNAAIETYEAVGQQQLHVLINGELYFVSAMNRAAGTISVFPWIDNTIGSSGTLEWVIGAGLWTLGNNSGVLQVENLNPSQCGRGLGICGLFGPKIVSGNMSYNGVGTMIGKVPTNSHGGTVLDAVYTEGNVIDYAINGDTAGNFYFTISSTTEVALSKVVYIGDLSYRGGDNKHTLGGIALHRGAFMVSKGAMLPWASQAVDRVDIFSSVTFDDHSRSPRIFTQRIDSQTVALSVVDTSYNRLFGYRGSTYRYIGTGTNGAPSGTFTFTPPAGGTINGGSVNANASFSGFYGPADFEIFHTDAAQLTWIVRPLTGWTGLRQAAAPSTTYAAPSTTYVAATGGTTVDAQARASQVQLAADVAAERVSLAQLAADVADLRSKLQAATVVHP